MSITTITIGGEDYTAYASVAEADAYLAVDPVRATTWTAKTIDEKGGLLVAATRRLDPLPWGGEKAGGATQENAFPRDGLTYADGTDATDTDVPYEVEVATILLAGTIAITPASSGVGSSGNNKKRLKAGSAEVEYFVPTAGKPLQDETAYAWIKQFLTGSGSSTTASTGAKAYGTCDTSTFDKDQLGYGLNRGYS